MIPHIATILAFQLVGEALSRSLALPVPGPVIGMALLLATFIALPRVAQAITPTAQGLLAHLSLLFVPAGVGVISHADTLGQNGLALVATLVLSTILALAVGALTFVGIARLTGSSEGDT